MGTDLVRNKGHGRPGLKIIIGPKCRCKVCTDHGNNGHEVRAREQRSKILTFAALSTSGTAR